MLKKVVLLVVAVAFFAFQLAVSPVSAAEMKPELRTVKVNEKGDTVTLTLEQVALGKKLFNDTCAQCHAGGVTKTSPDLDLSPPSLAGAIPSRDHIAGLVDYMKNPTTYDGETEIYELHPSTRSSDIFPEMRNLTDEELEAIAGHILSQPKVIGSRWGAGKTRYST
ncbi:photosystem II cytochrome c-550 [Limnothrix redekei]|uniref:Photosystem II extrinsic protein V n=1 Tax=Limnothrix redekei LRLZ20PSL1 TaxID=3112953 RepID=A0ABW7CH15_9CYAN